MLHFLQFYYKLILGDDILSKLFYQYLKLKKENNNKLYLFKSGIFYIALEDDAKTLSKLFNFKIINLNENVIKCGFPLKRLEYYTNMLKQNNLNFEIINNNFTEVENSSNYLNNDNLKRLINYIAKLDMNEISFKESFNILNDLNLTLRKIK